MSKEIELSKGYRAIVDDEDYEWLNQWNWSAKVQPSGSVYAFRNPRSGPVFMHRLILGVVDPDIHVDHKNRKTLDNRRKNIRTCTHAENMRNKRGLENTKSKYKGVSVTDDGKFRAMITVDKEQLHIGIYESEIEAAYAYNQLAKKHFEEFAYLNDIPEDERKKFSSSQKIYRNKRRGRLKKTFSRKRPYF